MTTEDLILKEVAEISIPYFFITVEFSTVAEKIPKHIHSFLKKKHEAILNGTKSRKFVYQKAGWRLIFTFFPTNSVVEERYALKNKVLKK